MRTLKPWKVLSFLLLAFTTNAFAQSCTVNGTVEDAVTGEPLIGAYVKLGNEIIATDLDGRFAVSIPASEATLEVSYIGYSNQSRQVRCNGGQAIVRFKMETVVMQEAVVAADLVISRKTPVAYTNILPAQIQ